MKVATTAAVVFAFYFGSLAAISIALILTGNPILVFAVVVLYLLISPSVKDRDAKDDEEDEEEQSG